MQFPYTSAALVVSEDYDFDNILRARTQTPQLVRLGIAVEDQEVFLSAINYIVAIDVDGGYGETMKIVEVVKVSVTLKQFVLEVTDINRLMDLGGKMVMLRNNIARF